MLPLLSQKENTRKGNWTFCKVDCLWPMILTKHQIVLRSICNMYLLDTHTLLWALFSENALSENAKKFILDDNDIYVSIASLQEIAIKQSIGKLETKESIEIIARICRDEDFYLLPILPSHLDYLKTLPQIHGDPFDRLLISQAAIEGLTIITKDSKIPAYEI